MTLSGKFSFADFQNMVSRERLSSSLEPSTCCVVCKAPHGGAGQRVEVSCESAKQVGCPEFVPALPLCSRCLENHLAAVWARLTSAVGLKLDTCPALSAMQHAHLTDILQCYCIEIAFICANFRKAFSV